MFGLCQGLHQSRKLKPMQEQFMGGRAIRLNLLRLGCREGQKNAQPSLLDFRNP
jgi:hypothetical protein